MMLYERLLLELIAHKLGIDTRALRAAVEAHEGGDSGALDEILMADLMDQVNARIERMTA